MGCTLYPCGNGMGSRGHVKGSVEQLSAHVEESNTPSAPAPETGSWRELAHSDVPVGFQPMKRIFLSLAVAEMQRCRMGAPQALTPQSRWVTGQPPHPLAEVYPRVQPLLADSQVSSAGWPLLSRRCIIPRQCPHSLPQPRRRGMTLS